MKQIELESIAAYLEVIKQQKESNFDEENFQEFLFRGQTTDAPLLPKICRLEARGDKLQAERQVLKEFKRTNPLLIKEHWPLDDWDYLALGQDDFITNIEIMDPFEVPSMKIVRPRVIKQRINNQSGLFSISSSKEILENRSINEIDSYDEKLIKIKVPSEKLLEIRTDLNSMGINAFSIFPELEGLCNYLQWLYFK